MESKPSPLSDLARRLRAGDWTKAQARWVLIGALALIVVAMLVVFLRKPPIEVETATIARGPIDETISDQGQARDRRVYVVSSPVAGEVERLPVEIGDRVEAGRTVVARIRPSPNALLDPRVQAQALAAVASARSALAAALAQRTAAEAEADRTAQALASGAASRQDADNTRAALRQAQAAVAQRQAELASAGAVLAQPGAPAGADVVVTAPAGGYVTHLLQQSQRLVSAGAPLVEVSDREGLEAAIEFLSQDAVKAQVGDQAEIYDWGGAKPIPAHVRLIEPQGYTKVSALGVEEQRALVILRLDGDPTGWAGLQPGYRVWGRVYLRRLEDAVLAPTGALIRSGQGWAVFRIEHGRARLRPVSVGIVTDLEAEITGGLSPGDAVAVFPSDDVKNGVRVKIKPASNGGSG